MNASFDQAVLAREVLRCPGCHLNQYRTEAGRCVRCRTALDAASVIAVSTPDSVTEAVYDLRRVPVVVCHRLTPSEICAHLAHWLHNRVDEEVPRSRGFVLSIAQMQLERRGATALLCYDTFHWSAARGFLRVLFPEWTVDAPPQPITQEAA